jgi:ribonuclease T1
VRNPGIEAAPPRPGSCHDTAVPLLVAVRALALALGLLLLTACGSATVDGTAQGSSSVPDAAALAPATPVSGLGTVTVSELPEQAVDTLRLIDSDGPFPYSKDGSTFGNREGILPPERSGYYREYTVETPGSDDRGARRIVSGADGERYYTDDHYDSFREIVSGEQ